MGLSDDYMYVTQKRLDKFFSYLSRSTAFHKFDQSPRPCEDCWVTYLDEPSTRPNCSPAIPLLISRHQLCAHIDAPVDLKTHIGVCDEVSFWFKCFHHFHGYPMHPIPAAWLCESASSFHEFVVDFCMLPRKVGFYFEWYISMESSLISCARLRHHFAKIMLRRENTEYQQQRPPLRGIHPCISNSNAVIIRDLVSTCGMLVLALYVYVLCGLHSFCGCVVWRLTLCTGVVLA